MLLTMQQFPPKGRRLSVQSLRSQPQGAASAPAPVVVHGSLAEAEADWRAIEATGILTPYQRYDWIRALLESGLEREGRIAIVVVHDDARPVALLPLIVERRPGFSIARLLGSDISNSDWLAFVPDTDISPEWLGWVLDEVRELVGTLDLVCLFNQPRQWADRPNPVLAIAADPGPNNLYTATIGPTPVPYIEHRLTHKRRGNIKRGERRLEEMLGKVELRRVTTSDELDRVHAAFLAQRGERFDQMGVGNLFAEASFVRFFKHLATEGFTEEHPALCFHALYAGEDIVATTCGAFAGRHYSQYINSTASGPAAKYSLMSILVARLMDELTTSGIETFDMGIGDFDYKQDWTAPEPLFDTLIPLTPAGHLAALGLKASQGAKRAIKQNPRLWGLAQSIRKTLHNLRRR